MDIQALAKKTESFSGSDLKRQSGSSTSVCSAVISNILTTDLCVSAALDAVKRHVLLPWSAVVVQNAPAPASVLQTDAPPASPTLSESHSLPSASPSDEPPRIRILQLQNFTKALKEITPSSSEALGSLAELRKWNDEFGEGRRDRRRKQVWGKDRFGFTDTGHQRREDGRVLHSFSDWSPTSKP